MPVIKAAVGMAAGLKTARQKEASRYVKEHPILWLEQEKVEEKRTCDADFIFAVIRTFEARGKGEYGGDVLRAVANTPVTNPSRI